MSVYKEGFKIVGDIQAQSQRIFSDACDHGVLLNANDSVFNSIKQLVNDYGMEETRRLSKHSTGKTLIQKVKLIDEWAVSDERKTVAQATELFNVSIVYCESLKKRGFIAYVSIEKVN